MASGDVPTRTRREAFLGLTAGSLAGALAVSTGGRVAATPSRVPEPSRSFFYRLGAAAPTPYAAGESRDVTDVELPVLSGISMSSLRVDPGAARTLHWHPNASEIVYVAAGRGEFLILPETPSGGSPSYVNVPVAPGSFAFAPKGSLHGVRNVGPDPLEVLIGFNHERPDQINVQEVLPWVQAPVLAVASGLSEGALPYVPAPGPGHVFRTEGPTAGWAPAINSGDVADWATSVDAITPGGDIGVTSWVASPKNLPRLEGIGARLVAMVPRSTEDPHWHADTAQLTYCLTGRIAFTIVGPDGEGETGVLEPGDLCLAPRNYIHWAVNVADDESRALLFTETPVVARVGLSQVFDVAPPEWLAAGTGLPARFFASFTNDGSLQHGLREP